MRYGVHGVCKHAAITHPMFSGRISGCLSSCLIVVINSSSENLRAGRLPTVLQFAANLAAATLAAASSREDIIVPHQKLTICETKEA